MVVAPTDRGLVIVVDPDSAIRNALAFSLELEGFDVETFDAGEALLSWKIPPRRRCLVLDERLPGASGLETITQLRERGFDAPAILIATHPPRVVRERAQRLGVAVIEKPLMSNELLHSVIQAVHHPQDIRAA